MADTDLILAGQTRTGTPVRVDGEVGPLVLDPDGDLRVRAEPADGTGFVVISTASTNLSNRRVGATDLYEITCSNVTATAAYVKLYNKASAPVVASDVPLITIPVPAGATVALNFGALGKRFLLGLSMGITGAIGATDATSAVAGIQVSGTYI